MMTTIHEQAQFPDTLNITVTQDHFNAADTARRNQPQYYIQDICQKCLVAQAAQEHFSYVPVGVDTITTKVTRFARGQIRYRMSANGQDLIQAFDKQDPIELPQTITLTKITEEQAFDDMYEDDIYDDN